MPDHIGGYSVEGRYFIVNVPEGWKETDPLPPVRPDDRWFDHVSAFKAALKGPWIRKPVWRSAWTGEPVAPVPVPEAPVHIDHAHPIAPLPISPSSAAARATPSDC